MVPPSLRPRVAVMYLGKIVEVGAARTALLRGRRAILYTQALLSAVPLSIRNRSARWSARCWQGDVAEPGIAALPGCRFQNAFSRGAQPLVRAEQEPPLEPKPGRHQGGLSLPPHWAEITRVTPRQTDLPPCVTERDEDAVERLLPSPACAAGTRAEARR